jgi:hypothetical protein
MSSSRTKDAVLEADFLLLRAKILEVAAGLDRFDRASGDATGDASNDPRRGRLDEAIRLLLSDDPDRAEHVQLLFSRPYSKNWRAELGV